MTNAKICSECLKAFEKRGRVDQFAERTSAILNCSNNCSCASRSVSVYSPFPIACSEDVAACASHPHHSAINGTVSHKVFDRAFTQGLSVTRLVLADEGIEQVLLLCSGIDQRKRHREPDLYSLGAVSLKAEDVRNIKFRGCESAAFRVYDTAAQNNVAHADIVGSKYFGKLADLPKPAQSIRSWAQLQLSKKMLFLQREPS